MSKISIILSVSILSFLLMIYNNISGELTAKTFMITSYMYIFMAIFTIILFNELNIYENVQINDFYMMILSLILLFAVYLVPKENTIIKNLCWLGFVIVIGALSNPIYNMSKNNGTLQSILMAIGSMILVMTYFAFTKPLGYFDSWYPYLFTSLIGLLFGRIGNMAFSDLKNPSGFLSREYLFSIVSVFVFNAFLMYDTQKLIKEGKILENICKTQDHSVCADYPIRTLDIILDILNLFANTSSIHNNN